MGIGLIITREVQIDIRLFITFKSQKCLKRYVISVFFQRRSAFGTDSIRQIPPAVDISLFDPFGFKLTVMAFRTVIMSRERIDFRDPRHGRDKG